MQILEASSVLEHHPRRFLVTGATGFIGSNLVERLLRLGQTVIALDNFITGHQRNLDLALAGAGKRGNFEFVNADIRDLAACRSACAGVDFVLHQAALGSVPRSIADPLLSHDCNVNGFLNILVAARDAGVKRVVYASSSSVYGDHPDLPKVEDVIGKPLSPYALTKAINEQYADVFSRSYAMELVGLRYFNVFGRRQDPAGPYAAVMPKWTAQLLHGEPVEIYGDGETSRDFCYVDNVVDANILAATADSRQAAGAVFNVAVGERTTLNSLYTAIVDGLVRRGRLPGPVQPIYRAFRAGDVRHSIADIRLARRQLGYEPRFDLAAGLEASLDWYCDNLGVSAR
ncbi:MAG: NAD-dependent epimerase/dehydratase [Devosia sp.]|uniref:SDR family oxidoreductase n=1 Tax=Devosia sp. TaxID=1871048 RepID=UPI00262A22D7|nr:SDR family oxidoreductase [Devosia sp.]MDB5540759.1 NAD-dependent epimerase/dehydratase [Devosia sp.]